MCDTRKKTDPGSFDGRMWHDFLFGSCFGIHLVERCRRRHRSVLLFQDKHSSKRERQQPAQKRNQRKSYAVPAMDLTAEQKIPNLVKERILEE